MSPGRTLVFNLIAIFKLKCQQAHKPIACKNDGVECSPDLLNVNETHDLQILCVF